MWLSLRFPQRFCSAKSAPIPQKGKLSQTKAMVIFMKANTQTPKKRLGYGWFIAAVIFLFNPCINIIDILPDFFGYLFLICGLTKWADLYLGMRVAVDNLSKLRIVMLVKMLAILLVPVVDENWVLILTFGFAIIELMYLLPALGKLFDGMDYFATRFDSQTPIMNVKNVRAFTYIFFILKAALTLLPELCALSDFEYSGYVTSGVQTDFADFRNLFILVNIFFSVLMGILWLVNIVPYINRIAADTPFLNRVLASYDSEIACDKALSLRRNTKKTITFTVAALAFIPNFAFDEFNVVPNFMVGIFVLAALVYLKRLRKPSKLLTIFAVASTVVSAASYSLSVIFESIHGIDIIRYRPDAFDAIALYDVTRVAAIVEYVVLLTLLILLFLELRKFIPCLLAPAKTDDKRLAAIEEANTKSIKGQLTGALVALIFAVLLNGVYSIIRAMIPAPIWAIPFFVSAICVICVSNMLFRLYEKIEYKYL